ncbi:MAG: sigma factor, partial [Solirubrobacterales bacterium]
MSKPLAPTRRREHNNDAQAFEIDEVATDLILKYGSTILRDARRYSACQADAEDAYQQSLVIMLTKAPSTEPDELIPWLRVIVRREAA